MAMGSVGSAVPRALKALSAAATIFTFSTICPTSFGSEAPVYGVFYGTQYEYANSSLMPWTIGAFSFEASVRARPAGEVTTTRLTAPTGSRQNMADETQGAYLVIPFPQETLRNMLFPPGNYTFTERLTTGADRTHTLTLNAGAAPAPAKFLDTTGWDAWPAGKPLRVTWEPGAGTLPTDTFVLAVHDLNGILKMFESPGPGEANALTAADTSFTIPGECLTNAGLSLVRIACYRSRGAVPELTGTYASTFGRFTIVAEAPNPVSRYHLLSGRVFEQEGENAPALLASNPNKFEAYLEERSLGEVLQARVEPPGKPAITLGHVEDKMNWCTTSMHVSSADLSAAWPAGNYKWTIDQTLGGTQEAVQTVSHPGTTVSPLRIVNLSQLRTNTFEVDTEVEWVPTGAVSADDRIEFIVTDSTGEEVLRLPEPPVVKWIPPQIIKGDATSLVINGHDLPENEELLATLRYIHVAQQTTNTLGGAEAISGHFAETRFRIGQVKPVEPAPLAILATPLEPGTAGAGYVAQFVASGGTRPYTWTCLAGNLPPGLKLSASGALQGTPTLAGDYAFTMMVRDANGETQQAPFAMTVNGTVPPLYIATTNLPRAHGSWPYLTELSSGGGLEPVKWEVVSGKLPRGVTLHKEHGIITGTPTEGGNFNVSVQLTDAGGTTKQRTLSLNVSEPEQPPLTISRCELITPRLLGLELNAEPGEPVSVEHSTDCASWTTLVAADYPSVGRFEIAPTESAAGFYRARWGRAPQPANPPGPVKPQLDTKLLNSATFEGTNSLSLALTNTLGHIYRLNIPSNSLAYSVDIKMQFVKGLADSPFPNGYHGGVELRPGGLTFLQPATLTVTFPQGVPSDYTPLAWDSGGWNPHLCIARTYSNTVVIPVMHFSGFGGAGASAGEAGNQQSRNPACPKYAGEESVGAAMKASAAQHQGAFDPADLIPAFKVWFDTTVWPGLKTAESDYLSLDYAIQEFQTWHRAFQLVGLTDLAQDYGNLPPGSGTAEQLILLSLKQMIETKVPKSMARGYANAIVQTHVRAVSEHDAWVAHDMLQYARSAELLGVAELLPNYLSLQAVNERLARIWRFEMLIDSVIDVDSGEGYFVEQVRSDRCPIELDPNTSEGTLAHLLQGFTTNIHMVSWEFQRGDAVGRTRPVQGKGQLRTYYLKVDPIYSEQTGNSAPEPKCTPDAPKYPVDAKITLMFYHDDPVKQMEAKDINGVWWPEPVGQTWEGVMKLAHSMIKEDYRFFKQVQFPQPGIDVYLAGSKVWTYSGGTIFADISHTRDFANPAGLITERTMVELYYAPKPLRDSDTKLPQ